MHNFQVLNDSTPLLQCAQNGHLIHSLLIRDTEQGSKQQVFLNDFHLQKILVCPKNLKSASQNVL
jgi:hypothetical protein